MRTRGRMSHRATGVPAAGTVAIPVTPMRTGADRRGPHGGGRPQHPD